jgi:hypothetical protein
MQCYIQDLQLVTIKIKIKRERERIRGETRDLHRVITNNFNDIQFTFFFEIK